MPDTELSRNIGSLILRRLATVKQNVVAEALEFSETKMSRISSGEASLKLSELGPFLAALGIVATEVGGNYVTLPRKKLIAMKILARDGLRFDGDEEGDLEE